MEGKYNGEGKQYYENGNIYYDGEFKNDRYHGYGILYYMNERKHYEGEWIKGKRDGKGAEYCPTNLSCNNYYKKYDGIWKENIYHRYGIEYYINGLRAGRRGFLIRIPCLFTPREEV